MVQERFQIGQRICVDDYIGTVRYLGPVPPTKGEWVGVEWDDPSRGKHDGSKDGVAYFTCRSETGGSFVRPHKVGTGISICEALLERYVSSDEGELTPDGLYFTNEKTNEKRLVERVGLDRVQRQFEDLTNLTVVGLRMQQISSAMKDGFVLKQASNIEELDLSKNLLDSWDSVGLISSHLEYLRQLNVSENLLKIPEEPESLANSFASLHTLIINGCQLKWNDVMTCHAMWPQIVELHLEKNEIEEISPPSDNCFSELKLLNLSGNAIKQWKYVRNLSKIPELEQLILNDCSFSEMALTEDDFTSLRKIFLSNNKFTTLDVFNELDKLQSLEELAFRHNPVLLQETAETMREIIIAKIAGLKKVNKSVVDEVERHGAEMDYLRRFGNCWRESGGDQDPEQNNPSEIFLKDHPRYMALVKEHGALDDIHFFVKSTSLENELLNLRIVVQKRPEIEPMNKKLPSSMTVGSLKLLISRLTKIPVHEQRLVYISHENPSHVVSMTKDSETLHYVSIEDEDTIEVRRNVGRRPIRVLFVTKSLKN